MQPCGPSCPRTSSSRTVPRTRRSFAKCTEEWKHLGVGPTLKRSGEEDSALVKPSSFQPVLMELASQLLSSSATAPSPSVSTHRDQMWSTDKVGMNRFSRRKPKRNAWNLPQRRRELASAAYFKMSCVYSNPGTQQMCHISEARSSRGTCPSERRF